MAIQAVEIFIFDVCPAVAVMAVVMVLCAVLGWPVEQLSTMAAIITGGWCEPNVRQQCCKDSMHPW